MLYLALRFNLHRYRGTLTFCHRLQQRGRATGAITKVLHAPYQSTSQYARDVKVSRPTWSRDHFFGLGLGIGLTVIGLGLGLGLVR